MNLDVWARLVKELEHVSPPPDANASVRHGFADFKDYMEVAGSPGELEDCTCAAEDPWAAECACGFGFDSIDDAMEALTSISATDVFPDDAPLDEEAYCDGFHDAQHQLAGLLGYRLSY